MCESTSSPSASKNRVVGSARRRRVHDAGKGIQQHVAQRQALACQEGLRLLGAFALVDHHDVHVRELGLRLLETGISRRHGGHPVAQRLTTVRRPW